MENINKELKQYMESNILPQYDDNIGGHGKEHIETVIQRSFEIIEEFDLNVNKDMVYTIAAFHDIGYKENPDKHEEESSKRFEEDENMRRFFTEEQIKIISEAITDHRASLEYEARSDYGKIVSSADRETSVEHMLTRSLLFQSDKLASQKPTIEQVIEASYKKLSSKYGKGGYAKMYYPDKKYTEYLEMMQFLLENKEKFVQAEMKLAKKLGINQREDEER